MGAANIHASCTSCTSVRATSAESDAAAAGGRVGIAIPRITDGAERSLLVAERVRA